MKHVNNLNAYTVNMEHQRNQPDNFEDDNFDSAAQEQRQKVQLYTQQKQFGSLLTPSVWLCAAGFKERSKQSIPINILPPATMALMACCAPVPLSSPSVCCCGC